MEKEVYIEGIDRDELDVRCYCAIFNKHNIEIAFPFGTTNMLNTIRIRNLTNFFIEAY